MESRESGFDTVDGSNPPPVLVNTPLFARFYICQVVQDFFHQRVLYRKSGF